MRWFLLVVCAASVQACAPSTDVQASTPPAPAADKQPSKPAKPEEPQTTVANSKRIYQLADLERVTLKAGVHSIPAWVMDTDGKREEGMMFLTDKEVKPDEGMLFVFPKADKQSFWMENTILPLDIVYITDKGRVLNIQKGKPFDRKSLPSSGVAQYVLELRQGAAERLGVRPGATITIPKGVHSRD